MMDERLIARFTAAGRIAVGAGFVAHPALAMRPWLGTEARKPVVRLLSRALGARDLVLGIGTLATLEDRPALQRWLQAALIADTTDFAVTLAERDHLPRSGRALVLAIAGGAVALGGAAVAAGRRDTV
jgi:hypothetical protein